MSRSIKGALKLLCHQTVVFMLHSALYEHLVLSTTVVLLHGTVSHKGVATK